MKVSMHHSKAFNVHNISGFIKKTNDKMLSCLKEANWNQLRPSKRQGEDGRRAWSLLDLSLEPISVSY